MKDRANSLNFLLLSIVEEIVDRSQTDGDEIRENARKRTNHRRPVNPKRGRSNVSTDGVRAKTNRLMKSCTTRKPSFCEFNAKRYS